MTYREREGRRQGEREREDSFQEIKTTLCLSLQCIIANVVTITAAFPVSVVVNCNYDTFA